MRESVGCVTLSASGFVTQARAGRNARTGNMVQIPAKTIPAFNGGRAFQALMHTGATLAGEADDVAIRRQTTCTNVIAPEFVLTADRITAAILSPFLRRIPGRGCPYSAQAGNASPAKGITRTATCHGW